MKGWKVWQRNRNKHQRPAEHRGVKAAMAVATVVRAAGTVAHAVERSTDGVSFTLLVTLGPNVTSYSNTGLITNAQYWYRVRAINAST